ncbi:hypothetical protein [Micromonospora humi]|uniref:Uncharacterized protein n=1 Tax=Micromonospora humi TaxID=745366 RepID=A0A1C5HQ53_9ACTN|nr:hypothetical protein [Micromonospora humi]SCG48124.1 hypothetical protein GA0070213_103425 [Micromonospora humi]
MSGFDEYAALIRELSTRQRGGERAIAAEAERRRGLQSGADAMGGRLAAQGAHLDRLGAAVGVPMAAVPDAPPAGPGPGDGGSGGGAAAPGRPDVGAYPGDPAAELATAGRLADEADRHGREAEALARRPVLLPAWSAPARAVAVYAGCALVGSLLMLIALVGSPLPVSGMDLVAALSCAGVPLMSFVAGQFVLARWGRPVLADGETPAGRYVPLGFVICALVSPSLFCVYLLLFRLLR